MRLRTAHYGYFGFIGGRWFRFFRQTNLNRTTAWLWNVDCREQTGRMYHAYQLRYAKQEATRHWLKLVMQDLFSHVTLRVERCPEFRSLYNSITEWREADSLPILLLRDWMLDNDLMHILMDKIIVPGLRAKIVWPKQWKPLIEEERRRR